MLISIVSIFKKHRAWEHALRFLFLVFFFLKFICSQSVYIHQRQGDSITSFGIRQMQTPTGYDDLGQVIPAF